MKNHNKKLTKPQNMFFSLNNHFILPASLLAVCFFSFLELRHYPNYVFSTYGVHYFDFLSIFFLAFLTYSIKLLLESNYKKFVFLLSIALFFIFTVLFTYPNDLFIEISREDNVLEYFQFIFYFLSGLFSFFTAKSLLKHHKILAIPYSILGLFLMLVAFEEISWGQRLFNYSLPMIQNYNYKNEINIHNQSAIGDMLAKAYVVAGFYGAFSNFFLSRLKDKTKFVAPPIEYCLYFLPILLAYLYIVPVDRIYQEEVAETLFSLGIMLYMILITYSLRNELPKTLGLLNKRFDSNSF